MFSPPYPSALVNANGDGYAVSEEFVLAGPDELVENWSMGVNLEPIAMASVGTDRVAIVWSPRREVDDTPLYPKGNYILAVVVP